MNEEDFEFSLTNILFLKEASTECQVKPLLRRISDEVENGIRLLKILVTRVPKKHTGVIIQKRVKTRLYYFKISWKRVELTRSLSRYTSFLQLWQLQGQSHCLQWQHN